MNKSIQQTKIGRSWLTDLGPSLLMVASLAMLGTTAPTALASPPALAPSTQLYTFRTVDAPGKDFANDFQLTWMNDSGLIIQQYSDTAGNWHTAVLSGSKWTVIDVPGAVGTGATNPNSQGQVALSYYGSDGVFHLAIWQRGHYTYIADPCPGYVFEGADGINDLGQVTSSVYDPATQTYLAYVGDSCWHTTFNYPGATFIVPYITNDFGVTVGTYWDSEGIEHAFIYNIYDGTHFSFDVPGGVNACANAINNEGDIVGLYFLASGSFNGFELQNGKLTAFNVPDAPQNSPQMITDTHMISGSYQDTNGNWHGFVATPVGRK